MEGFLDEHPYHQSGGRVILLKYIENSSIIEALGSVEVKFKEVVIFADKLILDSKTNIVTAEGNVKMKGADYNALSSSVTYSIDDDNASYNNFKTTVYPENIKGPLFLSADYIDDNKADMVGEEGTVTTCNYKDPHYFTAAQKIEYYPNDRIIGHNVTFYVKDIPVFWSPYMIYDLKQKRRRNWSFGHNEVEGNFIKTSWGYPDGQIFLDEMEKKSFGQGFTYEYKKENYNGDIYVYHIEEADTHLSDYVIKFEHAIQLSPSTKIGLNHSSTTIYQIPTGRLNQSTYSIALNHKSDKTLNSLLNVYDYRQANQEILNFQTNYAKETLSSSYALNMNQNKTAPRNINIAEKLFHQQNIFGDKTRLTLNADYQNFIKNAGEYGNELLTPKVEISHIEDFYNIQYIENWHMDLDRNLYAKDNNDTYVESQPELIINFNPVDLNLFNLSTSVNYGRFHEIAYVPSLQINRDYTTTRYKTSFNANKLIILGSTTFNINAGLDQFLYEPGDALNSFRESYGLNSQGFDFLKNETNYRRGISDGNSPFFFDKASTKYNDLKDILTFYHLDKFEWKNECGYNYETQKYFNYDTNLNLKPIEPLNLNWRSGFNIETQKYLELISTATLNLKDKLSVEFSSVNDLNIGGFKQGSCLINLETQDENNWQNHWNFRLGFVYDNLSKYFMLRDLMIIKDLHCWEVKYTYSDYKKEYAIMFTLKALPNEPFGYTEGRGFYFDSFEKALKEETSNESPQRY